MNPSSVKNIILDFGVVLINLDYKLTYEAFSQLGVHDLESKFAPATQQELFDKLEMGIISPNEFYTSVRKAINSDISDEQIKNAWNAMLLDVPKERIELLKKLKEKYRVFLLSNSNEIHHNAFSVSLKEIYGYDLFLELFEKAYFSHHINMRKPNADIFLHVIEKHNLNPEETIFIDDLQKNIDAANSCGIKGVLLKPSQDITDLIKNLTLL